MKPLLLLFTFLLVTNLSANTVRIFKIKSEHVTIFPNDTRREAQFKYNCIASAFESMIERQMPKRYYQSFRGIDLHIQSNYEQKLDVNLHDDRYRIRINETDQLMEASIKIASYISNHIEQLEQDMEKGKTDLLVDSQIVDIINDNLTKTQKKLLCQKYFRGPYNYKEAKDRSYETTLYSYHNDQYEIYCKGKPFATVPQIKSMIKTRYLGILIFDTDSTFVHLNQYFVSLPEEYKDKRIPERYFEYGKLSERHHLSEKYFSDFFLLDEDLDQYRIEFYLKTSNMSFKTISNYDTYILGTKPQKKRMIYLVKDDLLIENYEELLHGAIEQVRSNSTDHSR